MLYRSERRNFEHLRLQTSKIDTFIKGGGCDSFVCMFCLFISNAKKNHFQPKYIEEIYITSTPCVRVLHFNIMHACIVCTIPVYKDRFSTSMQDS